RLTTTAGVLAGANTPVSPIASYPGTVAATVGSPGSSAKGSALVTANAFNLPALACDRTVAVLPTANCTSPAISALIEGGPPLYGNPTTLRPAMDLNNSAAR